MSTLAHDTATAALDIALDRMIAHVSSLPTVAPDILALGHDTPDDPAHVDSFGHDVELWFAARTSLRDGHQSGATHCTIRVTAGATADSCGVSGANGGYYSAKVADPIGNCWGDPDELPIEFGKPTLAIDADTGDLITVVEARI